MNDDQFRTESAPSLNCEPDEVVIYESNDVDIDELIEREG